MTRLLVAADCPLAVVDGGMDMATLRLVCLELLT